MEKVILVFVIKDQCLKSVPITVKENLLNKVA